MKEEKKTIIISGINFFEGGPLSVYADCLSFLDTSDYVNRYKFVALVHNSTLFLKYNLLNIDFYEYPKSRSSYIYRLYYEYFHFRKFAKEHNPCFWLSLHDITPNVGKIPQAVYCHNPSPFDQFDLRYIYLEPARFFFRLFYKYLYKINIHRNRFVIVQQNWIREKFKEIFNINPNKIIVAKPAIPKISDALLTRKQVKSGSKRFFFPTYPRPFKNIELICEAVILLNTRCDFKVIITIDGSENDYARSIIAKYGKLKNIDFIGLLTRDQVYEYYSQIDCMIFPSKLETWGLPISEFIQFDRPIFVADRPYARESIGGYRNVNFFDPDDAKQLAELIRTYVENDSLVYDSNEMIKYEEPYAQNWGELFSILIGPANSD